MRTCEVTFHFPSIMNMFVHARMEIQGPTLDKVQQIVFNKFQQDIPRIYGETRQVFASSKEIVIRGEKEVICCDGKLQAMLDQTRSFEAYFAESPFSPATSSVDKSKDPYSEALKQFLAEWG